MPNTVPEAETYSRTTVPEPNVVCVTVYVAALVALAAPDATCATGPNELETAPVGGGVGAPPSAADAGAAASSRPQLNTAQIAACMVRFDIRKEPLYG